jgi:predicted nucleic acid-binding protein
MTQVSFFHVQNERHKSDISQRCPFFTPASKIGENYQLSFWDGLIVAAAYSKNAAIILTEDMNHGQIIEGIRIENPFL